MTPPARRPKEASESSSGRAGKGGCFFACRLLVFRVTVEADEDNGLGDDAAGGGSRVSEARHG